MSGSRFGKNFSVNTWGESHGPALGAVIDGCPAGISLSVEDIQRDMDRRRPGVSPYATKRTESDKVSILSGVFGGKTTGAPIALMIKNSDQRSGDYDELQHVYRPGHADFVYDQKYGIRDYRGGGRSSGRETSCRVMGGAVAKKMLAELGITARAYTVSIGSVSMDRERFDFSQAALNPFCIPDKTACEQAEAEVSEAIDGGYSLGGVAECVISGVKPGVGEPVFDKFSAVMGQAIFSINAVKAVEFGAGFGVAKMKGYESNDAMIYENGERKKLTNHGGGVSGGMTDGSDIIFRAAFKPTSSISMPQRTITDDGRNIEISIKGRHDPLIVPRAVVVMEAMAALVTADLCLQSLSSNICGIKKIWGAHD